MANEDVVADHEAETPEQKRSAGAAGARKPGVVARMIERCRGAVESIRLPRLDWRTFGWGLLVLILAILICRNWAPVRINLLGWYLDAPRAVVFAVFFVLGAISAWLWETRARRAEEADEGGEEQKPGREQEEEVAATPIEELEEQAADEAEAWEDEPDSIETEDDQVKY